MFTERINKGSRDRYREKQNSARGNNLQQNTEICKIHSELEADLNSREGN